MEQQLKKKELEEQQANVGSSSSSSGHTSENKDKSPEEMSVDELNSLTAEQRRDQMLQALQKRTSSS